MFFLTVNFTVSSPIYRHFNPSKELGARNPNMSVHMGLYFMAQVLGVTLRHCEHMWPTQRSVTCHITLPVPVVAVTAPSGRLRSHRISGTRRCVSGHNSLRMEKHRTLIAPALASFVASLSRCRPHELSSRHSMFPQSATSRPSPVVQPSILLAAFFSTFPASTSFVISSA